MPTNLIVRQGTTGVDVTPSDSVDVTGATANTPATLFVGTGGDVEVITLGGSTLVLKNIADGSFLPIQVTRVKATNTTATDIVALF
jgi:hypothetical protein